MAEPVSTLAAQAMRDFSQDIKSGKLKPGYWLTQTTACLEALRNAVHFSVHEKDLMDALVNQQNNEDIVYAPYKTFTVQINADFEGDITSLLVCSVNDQARPELSATGKDYLYVWHIYEPKLKCATSINKSWCVDLGQYSNYDNPLCDFPPPEIPTHAPPGFWDRETYRDTCYYSRSLLSMFLDCLRLTHTEEVIQQASPKNNRRILDGKLPIWEVKTLVLKTPVTRTVSEYQGGTHASPRQHIRRGHYRHYKSGKIAWVRDCIVGSLEKGFVHKDYRVEPAAA